MRKGSKIKYTPILLPLPRTSLEHFRITATETLAPITHQIVTLSWGFITLALPAAGRENQPALIGAQSLVVSKSITYTYNPLNRLSETACIGASCTPTTTNYVYDNANRLTSVGGVSYTWDDNGNLLDDSAHTYVYDHANRLKAVSNQQSAVSYGYNGLGDRLQQTVNSATTNYTLDLNAGLPQVLSDGTDTYLYGAGRIAQQSAAGKQYFLGDALGSVRQLADSGGAVSLARSYQPYGKLLASDGSGTTSYGFTGKFTSYFNELVYLRSRWYSPQIGRFSTRDSWQGDYTRPISLNKWNYAYANPVLYTDPSGQTPAIVAVLLPSLIGAGAGFAAGTLAGGIFGYCTYEWALAGECGCDMQQQALSMTKREWVGAHALGAGIIGGVGGAIAAAAPVGLIAVGVAGFVISGVDIYNTYNIIKNETGITACTVSRLIIDVVGMVFSGIGIVKGVRAWRASGSLLRWRLYNPPGIPRKPEDIAVERNYPKPPAPNWGNSNVGGSAKQNADVKLWVRLLRNIRADDIRVNQEQVNGSGIRVGINKPDLQFTYRGQRYYAEWDTPQSSRGIFHAQRIQANDPAARGVLQITFPYIMPNLDLLPEHIVLITMP